MEAKFSPRVKDMINYSRDEAVRLSNEFLGAEHLLLGLIRLNEGTAIRILKEFNIDLVQLKDEIEKILAKSAVRELVNHNVPLLKQAENIIKQSYLEAKEFKQNIIGTEHLLLTILRYEDAVACQVLNKYGVMYANAREEYELMLQDKQQPRAEFPGSGQEEGEENFGQAQRKSADPKSKTPVLDNFGRDLTKMAELGRLDPIVGR